MAPPTVPRLFEQWLRATLGPERASTCIGDLEEELAARNASGRPVRFGRLWWLRHTAGLTTAGTVTSASRAFRTWGQIARDAIRGLRASPRTTVLAVLILTLGMSAAIVTFSVVDHVVLRRLPFPDDDRLVTISGHSVFGPTSIVAPQDYFAWRNGADTIEHLTAWMRRSAEVRLDDRVETVPALVATTNVLDMLKVRPLLGRPLAAEHEGPGATKAVLIGEELWQSRLGAARDIVGRAIILNGAPHEILGVVPAGHELPVGVPQPAAIWLPYVARPEERTYQNADGRGSYLQVTGRLREGASLEEARAQVEAITASLAVEYPQFLQRWQVRVTSLREAVYGRVRGWMLLVLWAVVLVLAVTCVNLANLLLARSSVRARDFAVRAALGATRGQLARALIVESLLLSSVATVVGVVAASWALDAVKAALPEGISRAAGIAVDARILAAAVAAAFVTGMAFGLVPALQASRGDVISLLKATGPPVVTARRRRWRSALLTAEMAVVSLLLVATSLLVASFVRVMTADLGFDRSNLLTVSARASWGDLPQPERARRAREYAEQALGALKRLPGVVTVGALAGGGAPLSGGRASTTVSLPDAGQAIEAMNAEQRRVSAAYFDAAGIRFVDGRPFSETPDAAGEVILDSLAVLRLAGGRSPVNMRVRLAGTDERVVVGVVRNVRVMGPESELTPHVYLPLDRGLPNEFVIRTSRPAQEMIPAVRTALQGFLPSGVAPPAITVVDTVYRQITADRRFAAWLMTIFGALALVIGAAGIYSVMSSIVAQQTREIGIRTALGATRQRIAKLVLSEAVRHVAFGLGIGLAIAWAASGIFSSLVFGVTPTEPALYLIVVGVLAVVALAAAWIPARRASRVDPIVALRE